MSQPVVTRSPLLLALLLAWLPLGAAAAPVHVAVSIANLQFKPASIKIHVGDTVIWTNNDDRDHSVVAVDGSFKSGNIKSGKMFEFTFNKPGSYAYGCSYHPRMKGMVVVE